jgi:hypothetical protein
MFDLFLAGGAIKNSITMPGILLKTNADSINGSQAFWNYNERYFFAKDYKMMAESRIINKWAFAVTAIILLSLIFLILKGIKRK